MTNICRLCLSSDPSNVQIDLIQVLDKLRSCFRLKISSRKILPSLICAGCRDFIEKANSFRETVILNEEKLLADLSKDTQQSRTNEIKPEAQDFSRNISDKDIDKGIKCEDKIKSEEDSLSLPNENSISFDVHNDDYNSGTEIDKLAITESKELMYKCLTCFESFESLSVLRSHYHKIHLVKVSKKYSQYSIMKKDNGCNSFKCEICEKSYNEKKYIVRHLQSHDDHRPLLCKVCGRTYKTVSEIILHNRAHSDSKLLCSYRCGFSTSYNGALKVHEKGHRKEYKYKCKKCDRGFHVKTWYLQHQNQHTGVKPYICDICGLSFYMDRSSKQEVYLSKSSSSSDRSSSSSRESSPVRAAQPVAPAPAAPAPAPVALPQPAASERKRKSTHSHSSIKRSKHEEKPKKSQKRKEKPDMQPRATTSTKITARDIMGSDSDVENEKKAGKKDELISYMSRRVSNGISKQFNSDIKGSRFVDLKLYMCNKIENISPMNRWRQAVVTLKMKMDDDNPAYRHLVKFLKEVKKKL